jgi:hypothetical protein
MSRPKARVSEIGRRVRESGSIANEAVKQAARTDARMQPFLKAAARMQPYRDGRGRSAVGFSGSDALPKRFEPLVERSAGALHTVASSSDDGALGFQLALEQIANALENLIVAA